MIKKEKKVKLNDIQQWHKKAIELKIEQLKLKVEDYLHFIVRI